MTIERRPQVTIVIVNYNYGDFISEAIDSALAQTYRPLEVVIVDDGSTDGSRRAIATYGDRVRPVLQENGGQGAAYNAGWRAARGDIVLFLDSDDVLSPDAMLKTVAAFEQSDAVKVQFYLSKVDRHMKPLGYLLPSYSFSAIHPHDQINKYGYYVSPPASGNAFRKTFLDEIMPIADAKAYRAAADGYTTGLAGVAGRVVSISEVLGYYRVHGANNGGEAGVKSIRQLHHMFMRDIRRENTQHAFADKFNFHFAADRSRFCPGHTKLRLLSRRILPEAHPIETDRVAHLVASGLIGAWTFPHLTPIKRLEVALGFVAMGIAPRPMLCRMFDGMVSPKMRNREVSATSLPLN